MNALNVLESYEAEVARLRPYCEVVELTAGQSKLAFSPQLQGRILTSCTQPGRPGFGWVNHDLIKSGQHQPGINAFGGEDRFWIGPEAGQFAIFFQPGAAFTQTNWQTPACIDTESFKLEEIHAQSALLSKECVLKNYQGKPFHIEIRRRIRMHSPEDILIGLSNVDPGLLQCVGFETANAVINRSTRNWNKNTGLLNIWILGKFPTGDQCWAILPACNGYSVNQNYFPADLRGRLIQKADHSLLKADGKMKAKIGLSPTHDRRVLGSYDLESGTLTIVKYQTDKNGLFLNSEWQLQDHPFSGDVLNVYNDGPDDSGRILGPYYELETSSSSRELKTNERIEHLHQTYHFSGDFEELNKVAKQWLFVDLNTIKEVTNAG